MAGLLKSVVSDVGQAAHMLGDLSLDPTCLMLMAASADCALKAVAFRAQVRSGRSGTGGVHRLHGGGSNRVLPALEPPALLRARTCACACRTRPRDCVTRSRVRLATRGWGHSGAGCPQLLDN